MSADARTLESILVGAADPEIVALETAMRAAQLGADVSALDGLISDDLLFTGPDGRVGTKAEDLAAYRSGKIRFVGHEPEELHVRRLRADVAIANLRVRLTVQVGGNTMRGTYRYTRVWVRNEAGHWQVVGGHVSEVPTRSPR